MQNRRFSSLDGLRGLAALSVFLWHLLAVFYTNTVRLQTENSGGVNLGRIAEVPMGFAFAWIFNGHLAVTVFFTLSGFVMAQLVFSVGPARPIQVVLFQRFLRLLPVVALGSVVAYGLYASNLFFLQPLAAINGVTDANPYDIAPRPTELLAQVAYKIWVGMPARQIYDSVLWSIGLEFQGSMILLAALYLFKDVTRRVWVHLGGAYSWA